MMLLHSRGKPRQSGSAPLARVAPRLCKRAVGGAFEDWTVKTYNRPRGKTALYPVFSPDDIDLASAKWKQVAGYAGRTRSVGYKTYVTDLAHRLVLERMVGRPLLRSEICDHINGDILDNRRENLRMVTTQQNCQNRHHDFKQGRNVRWNRANQNWVVSLKVNYKHIWVGAFLDKEDAVRAAESKRKELGYLNDLDAPAPAA